MPFLLFIAVIILLLIGDEANEQPKNAEPSTLSTLSGRVESMDSVMSLEGGTTDLFGVIDNAIHQNTVSIRKKDKACS